jgi:hypothetical protein
MKSRDITLSTGNTSLIILYCYFIIINGSTAIMLGLRSSLSVLI